MPSLELKLNYIGQNDCKSDYHKNGRIEYYPFGAGAFFYIFAHPVFKM
jgi:hypothetical protein